MACELRVAGILAAAAAPLTEREIAEALGPAAWGATGGATGGLAGAVRTTLFGTLAYDSVPGSFPPRWFIRGSEAEAGGAGADEAEAARGAGADEAGAARGAAPFSLEDLPPLAAAFDDEFAGRDVAVAGAGADAPAAAAAVALLVAKGAARLRCLIDQPAGALAAATARAAGVDVVECPAAGGRRAMTAAHAAAFAQAPAALCLVGDPPASRGAAAGRAARHLLATAEALGVPVFFVSGAE